MPGTVVWPGVTRPGSVSDTMVSTMDIFPTALHAAGVTLSPGYIIDGQDMLPVLKGNTTTQHAVFLHYCGFNIVAARVHGRFKLFWATQKWYTHDAANFSICTECCNGVNPASLPFAPATFLCGCSNGSALVWHAERPLIYDLQHDILEVHPVTTSSWPQDTDLTYADVVRLAEAERGRLLSTVHPLPDKHGAGSCTGGLPGADRQPCCPGCSQRIPGLGYCDSGIDHHCSCNNI